MAPEAVLPRDDVHELLDGRTLALKAAHQVQWDVLGAPTQLGRPHTARSRPHLAQAAGLCRPSPVARNGRRQSSSEGSSECRSGGHGRMAKLGL